MILIIIILKMNHYYGITFLLLITICDKQDHQFNIKIILYIN